MSIFSAANIAAAPSNTSLDAGKYEVVISKAEPVTSKKKGTPGVKFDLTIQSGPEQENGQAIAGKHFFPTVYVNNDIGMGKIKKLFKILDIDIEDPDNQLENGDVDFSKLAGARVIATNKPQEYDGEMQDNISSFGKVVD